jgi:hypothetical protein
MRLDQVSGWELMAVQVVVLAVVATTLWAAGVAFRRSRPVRALILVLAPAVGAAIAAGILNADEAAVSAYLFALVLFMLGTLAMSVMLLAAIPQTRGAALGGLAAGGLVIVAFILTYYALFTFGQPRWLQPPG